MYTLVIATSNAEQWRLIFHVQCDICVLIVFVLHAIVAASIVSKTIDLIKKIKRRLGQAWQQCWVIGQNEPVTRQRSFWGRLMQLQIKCNEPSLVYRDVSQHCNRRYRLWLSQYLPNSKEEQGIPYWEAHSSGRMKWNVFSIAPQYFWQSLRYKLKHYRAATSIYRGKLRAEIVGVLCGKVVYSSRLFPPAAGDVVQQSYLQGCWGNAAKVEKGRLGIQHTHTIMSPQWRKEIFLKPHTRPLLANLKFYTMASFNLFRPKAILSTTRPGERKLLVFSDSPHQPWILSSLTPYLAQTERESKALWKKQISTEYVWNHRHHMRPSGW